MAGPSTGPAHNQGFERRDLAGLRVQHQSKEAGLRYVMHQLPCNSVSVSELRILVWGVTTSVGAFGLLGGGQQGKSCDLYLHNSERRSASGRNATINCSQTVSGCQSADSTV